MRTSKILLSSESFTKEFVRCCNTYSKLSIAVAWCGNPEQTLPYIHLENFKGKIEVILGISFFHTHPNAFEWFKKIGSNIRIYRDNLSLFHPKIYLFTKGNKFALFIGSSNLTNSGFYSNIEANSLLEGSYTSTSKNEIQRLKGTIKEWQKSKYSFNLRKSWLDDYTESYNKFAKKERQSRIKTARRNEEEIGQASWLKNADWNTYYSVLKRNIKEYNRDPNDYFKVLETAKNILTKSWRITYFKDIEKRRIIGGYGRGYETFGVVTASGRFNHLLKSGPDKDWKVIVMSINAIVNMKHPINWNKLELELEKLVDLGFSMKVWGRLLCITRPELYCTISSHSVRQNLSDTLDIPRVHFTRVNGYIKLIRMIHSSPWFNSKKPKNQEEAEFWKYRVAMLDAIFYDP